jgi:hypothetical protein
LPDKIVLESTKNNMTGLAAGQMIAEGKPEINS